MLSLLSMAPKEKDGFNMKRCRVLTKGIDLPDSGPVLYWMSRDQRVEDNWALLYAQRLAAKRKAPVFVVFCLVPKFLDATIRQFHFLLEGLKQVEATLKSKKIPFFLKLGCAKDEVPKLCSKLKATTVVCDMSPLRVPMIWTKEVATKCGKKGIPCHQVDAHNVVPVWIASDKLEYAARTIRPKITKLLPEFLTDIPSVVAHKYPPPKASWPPLVKWTAAEKSLKVDRKVQVIKNITPGSAAAHQKLKAFCNAKRLKFFAKSRNNPNEQALSGLSPYLHFGQISGQRCALAVKACGGSASASFIEELVVRRELGDNFCFYNPRYDSLLGCTEWAQITLKKHEKDKRPYVYSRKQLDEGKTHDDLWNAAQMQMVRDGKMHGFLRMYWAKKILEWSPNPKEALDRAIYLNDRYQLDGRDPNGYVGCMWSIGGIHDMGWTERPIFGKIRFMNYEGCKRKFNVPAFVARYPSSTRTAAPSASADEERPAKKAKRA